MPLVSNSGKGWIEMDFLSLTMNEHFGYFFGGREFINSSFLIDCLSLSLPSCEISEKLKRTLASAQAQNRAQAQVVFFSSTGIGTASSQYLYQFP